MQSLASETVPASEAFRAQANLSAEAYHALYARSISHPEAFWAEQAERLEWMRRWSRVRHCDFADNARIRWFEGGALNVSANCLDRHLQARGDKPAILWVPDAPGEARAITYRELHAEVCRFANVLKALGVQKGERVTIFLPMIPLAAAAMLACARIGAVHSVVFAGFSAEALAGRIRDCGSGVLITADEGVRGGKRIRLKEIVDAALAMEGVTVRHVLTVKHTGGDIAWSPERDRWYAKMRETAPEHCAPEPVEAEDPFFILYTSGSTGKPKGVLHTTGGYLLFTALTHAACFDLKEEDVYFCTADIGWVTGHSYLVYGPLANGATSVMFEGVPNYPDPSRLWRIVDALGVTVLYTAPTALRSLMREGDDYVRAASRKSLRLLGSVGEPINPEAWRWFHEVVGEGRCPVVDTWWQTETGGVMIAPLPGAIAPKPGSATLPFFGVRPEIVNPENGAVLEGEAEGALVIADSWPGQARSIYGDHERFVSTYFSPVPGKYYTGDGARRDADGYYWITGRIDDVLNVSGHRLGTAEIESALVAHEAVAEAAVVGYPHDIKGQGIYAYVTLKAGRQPDEQLDRGLKAAVRQAISAIATPDVLHYAPVLPKTRSGKIMRRILRKIAAGDTGDFGDTSTLTDPGVVEQLIAERGKYVR
ncbi:MAG: acetate--CoA ligase [Alphaproteobacteria bacterium]|nr:acetate--CoA ligase [Alphaproteobacteria bacterium]